MCSSDLFPSHDNPGRSALNAIALIEVFIPHLSKHHRTNAEHHAYPLPKPTDFRYCSTCLPSFLPVASFTPIWDVYVSAIQDWDIYKNYYANKQEEIGAAIDLQTTNVQHNVNTMEVNSSALPQTGISTEALQL